MSQDAEEMKMKGNEYFKEQKYELAISLYSQAIDIDNTVAVYYANRANAYFQEGCFKNAEEDAKKAIELDDKYMKGYWRMAEICRCVGRQNEALEWYKKANTVSPGTKSIKLAIEDMERKLKLQSLPFSKQNLLTGLHGIDSRYTKPFNNQFQNQMQYSQMNKMFSSPFGGSAPATVSEVGRTFEISNNLQEKYKTVDQKIEFLESFFKYCSESNVLHSEQLNKLIVQSGNELNKLEVFNHVTFKENQKITVVGDLHGSNKDFIKLFKDVTKISDFMKSEEYLVILGDYVDRGPNGHQILCFVLAMQLMCPERVFLIRGNHETPSLNNFFGYQGQVDNFYGTASGVFTLMTTLFQTLPLLLLVDQGDKRYCFFHGGLPVASSIQSLDDLFSQLPSKVLEPQDPISQQLLWSDPAHEETTIDMRPSHRGVGYIYSAAAYNRLREKLGITTSFRGHEMVLNQTGLRDDFGDGRHYTVFSSSDYMGQSNTGGAAVIDNGEIKSVPFK